MDIVRIEDSGKAKRARQLCCPSPPCASETVLQRKTAETTGFITLRGVFNQGFIPPPPRPKFAWLPLGSGREAGLDGV